MSDVVEVLKVAVPTVVAGGFGVWGGRQSRQLELDKLKELHRQKVEDREHEERRAAEERERAEREGAEASRAAAVAGRKALLQELLEAADATPAYSNVPGKMERDAWARCNAALAAVEFLHDDEITEAARKLASVGRWNAAEYTAARLHFIEVAAATRAPSATSVAVAAKGREGR